MEVFLELTSEVVQVRCLEGRHVAGVKEPLIVVLNKKIVVVNVSRGGVE